MKRITIILALVALAHSAWSQTSTDDTYYQDDQSSVTVQAQTAPPPIPDYVQPPCPVDGYIWTPGYWYWNGSAYTWIPGVWVAPPSPGLLWTPGYWSFYGGYYGWHRGYWGASIGYYGGINYGFGYYGTGFVGGRWDGGHFLYNTAVWHVGGGIHNVYVDKTVVVNHPVNHASFNGPNGVHYRPTGHEVEVMHGTNHTAPAQNHVAHETTFSGERGQVHNPQRHPAVHSVSQPGGQRFNQGGHAVRMGGGHGGGRH